MKTCSKCGETKDMTEFDRDKYKPDGRIPSCKKCKSRYSKKYYSNNKDKRVKYLKNNNEEIKIRKKNYYEKTKELNKEKRSLYDKNWYQENKENVLAKQSRYRDSRREIYREYFRQHYQKNVKIYRAKSAKYRADLLYRTPDWADLEAIKEFYKNCPEGYHVDHIYPLRGKKCSGLHVLENLQYLPAEENLKKGCKMPEEWELIKEIN